MKIISIFVDMPKKPVSKKRIHPRWYITKDLELVSSEEGRPRNILTEISLNNVFLTKKEAKIIKDLLVYKPRKKRK
jgi:hypothetical protein